MYFWRSLVGNLSICSRPPTRAPEAPDGRCGPALSRMLTAFDRWAERNFADLS